MADCEHMEFSTVARIARLQDTPGGKVTGFMAELKISCLQCSKPFQFLGLAAGLDTQGARVSLDGLEANIAITPQGTQPNPFQRMAYNVERFDG